MSVLTNKQTSTSSDENLNGTTTENKNDSFLSVGDSFLCGSSNHSGNDSELEHRDEDDESGHFTEHETFR